MAPLPATALPLPAIDDDEDVAEADHGEAWNAELDRRIADVREGRVQLVPWEEVQANVKAMLARMKRERSRASRGTVPRR